MRFAFFLYNFFPGQNLNKKTFFKNTCSTAAAQPNIIKGFEQGSQTQIAPWAN